MIYDLNDLVAWTRRHGGDTVQSTNERATSDGTRRVLINNEGNIAVDRFDLQFVTLEEGTDYEVEGNIITLTADPVEGDDIFILYRVSRYTDREILDFLVDASRGVKADMKFTYSVDEASATIEDTESEMFDGNEEGVSKPYAEIEQLIVYRAGALLYAHKTNQAADDAILIRDGDTTIDTSKTAASTDKALTRLGSMYTAAVLRARSEGFMGTASSC
jgi:hypothetical protein